MAVENPSDEDRGRHAEYERDGIPIRSQDHPKKLLLPQEQDPSRVIIVESVAVWDEILRQANTEGSLVVVHFSADWCAPCKFMIPIFEELSRTFPDTIFLRVDVDDLPGISKKWEIKAMPTFIIIKDEEQVDKFVGANKEELEKRLVQFGQSSV